MLDILLITIGFLLLVKGADYLVEGASHIAKRFHIPEIVIGLTIVAIGTSMPELVVSLTSALEGHSDIAVGNIIGSNIANMFLILGMCSIIKPLEFKKQSRLIENPLTLFFTILLFVLCNNGNSESAHLITKNEGILLLVLCVLYIVYNIIMAKKGEKFDLEEGQELQEETIPTKILKAIFNVIIGIIGLKLGGDLVVRSCVAIASSFGVSEELISLTIVAVSTSLPELITSITATRKGETDMAIGNILGSQIFNIVLIIGASAFLCPINYATSYNKYMIVLIMGTIMLSLFPFVGTKNKMTRSNGIPFVFIYILYMISLVMFQG